MKNKLALQTFFPSEDHPLFSSLPGKIYPASLFALQKAGDTINPEFAAAGIAVTNENNETLGRLVLYANTGIRYNGKKTAIAGNYECVDDAGASLLLLESAAAFAKKEGFHILLGPANGTTWDTYRFCTGDLQELFFSEMVNLPYYPAQWKNAGFGVAAKYVSTIDHSLKCDGEEVLAIEKKFLGSGFRIRNIDIAQYENELELLFPFLERSFAGNFLYTPVSREIFLKKYTAVKPYLDPRSVFIAENPVGNPVAVAFCFPDHLNKKEKRLIVKTLARDPDPRYKGLGEVLGNLSQRFAKQNGYEAVIHALMYTENYSLKLSGNYAGKIFREYELYSKEL
ncbi:MAG TPA: hypothetical protein VFU15_15230 [Bacteroidia bacterium]|nr:hypothetical protein [Bacteroidia bacterium]